MVLPALNSDVLQRKLSDLSVQGQRAFGALCCERLLPNYIAFQTEVHSGDQNTLRDALDLVWQCLSDQLVARDKVEHLVQVCEFLAPSSDDFDDLRVSSAQDACFAICSLLDHLLDPNVTQIVQVATYATDSIDLFVQEVDDMSPADPQLEKKILMHPLMQKELNKQESDIESIKRLLALGADFSALRKGAEKGNLAAD